MSRAAITQLEVLVSAAEESGYSLPEALVAAHATLVAVKGLTIPTPPTLDVHTAAARAITATAAGEPVDLLALAGEAAEAQLDRQRYEQAQLIRSLAIEQAGEAAQHLASDIVEQVITQHLRPALEQVHAQAREAGAALGDYSLDAHTLLAAPAKVRAAYLKLPELVARQSAIWKARRLINTLGYREVKHDGAHLYGEFERPLALSPHWKPPARIPPIPAPEDPTARLLWVVSEQAAPARPWLPTVAQQDAAWLAQFGPEAKANEARAKALA
jgi:hypothetical protein